MRVVTRMTGALATSGGQMFLLHLDDGSKDPVTRHCEDEEALHQGQKTNRAILMQFTGLHDTNGKEIYEGDIVTDDESAYDPIEWSNYWCGRTTKSWFGSKELAQEANNLEVIGNTYEDPRICY
jgi:hypothetical protein